ncbi:hypothetical protein N9P58_01900 [Puniceicoccaceae bacterium]|nr:hypothetical protein [Puniceicoccaceae bacterium]
MSNTKIRLSRYLYDKLKSIESVAYIKDSHGKASWFITVTTKDKKEYSLNENEEESQNIWYPILVALGGGKHFGTTLGNTIYCGTVSLDRKSDEKLIYDVWHDLDVVEHDYESGIIEILRSYMEDDVDNIAAKNSVEITKDNYFISIYGNQVSISTEKCPNNLDIGKALAESIRSDISDHLEMFSWLECGCDKVSYVDLSFDGDYLEFDDVKFHGKIVYDIEITDNEDT